MCVTDTYIKHYSKKNLNTIYVNGKLRNQYFGFIDAFDKYLRTDQGKIYPFHFELEPC